MNISDDELNKYIAGDDSLKDKVILAHINIAQAIANKYYRLQLHKGNWIYQDIRACAYLGLCQAVAWAPIRLKHQNITGYIKVTIKRFVRNFLDSNSTIRIPRSAIRKMLKLKDNEIEQLFPLVVFAEEMIDTVAITNNYIDIYTVIEYLKLTEREHMILKLLIQGYKYREISIKLNISLGWIHKKVKDLRIKARRYIENG
jgi:DNA-directed RNA polymerase specialized sigma subunit